MLTAFGLAFGGTLLLAGRLGDLYGRRRLLTWGMATFAAGSLAVAIAPLASGVFETANHLFGGAVGVALYATVLAATTDGTAFAVAAALAFLGIAATRPARR